MTFWDYDSITVSSWFLVCHRAWPRVIFFPPNYPWNCSAADQTKATLSLELTPPLSSTRCPPKKHSGRGRERQRTNHQAPHHSCLVTQPLSKKFWKCSFKKQTNQPTNLLLLFWNNWQDTNNCLYTQKTACSDGDLQPRGWHQITHCLSRC